MEGEEKIITQVVLYIGMGMLDVLALFALMLRFFRLPYWTHIKEIAFLSTLIAVISYVIRVYFEGSAVLDTFLHYILYILFIHYVLRYSWLTSFLTSTMYFGYGIISILAYLFYAMFVFEHLPPRLDPQGLLTYSVQTTQILVAFLLAYTLYKFRLGFSFAGKSLINIMKPLSGQEMKIINIAIVLASIAFSTLYLVLKIQSFILIPLYLVSFAVLLYYSYKRDLADEELSVTD